MTERIHAALGGVLLLLSLTCCAQAAEQVAEIEWSECPTVKASASGARVDCGWLATGATLDDEPVKLRVAVLRARPDRRDPTPVIYIPGGPGDSARLDAPGLTAWQRWQQRAGWPHDVVLFDPRGTGESRPRPACDRTQSGGRFRPAMLGLVMADEFTEHSASMANCYKALGRATVDALGPAAQVDDIAALVTGLGVERATLWGVSYGTRIARLFADRYPDRTAALVLDSLFPFTRDDLLAMPAQLAEAVAALDAWCDDEAARCHELSARPSDTVASLLKRYDRAPPSLVGTDRLGRVRVFRVTAYRLLLAILLAGYDSGTRDDTVQRLERARGGHSNALWPLIERLEKQSADPGKSDAVFWSTRCALRSGETDDKQWSATLARYPVVAQYVSSARQAPVCDRWRVTRFRPPTDDLSELPVLVVGGTQDPATPPRWAQAFVAAHPRVRYVRVDGAGHAVTLANRCAQRAVAAFLADPTAPLSDRCRSHRSASRTESR